MKNLRQILVVEDDEGIQRQLKWTLSDYDVLLAGNKEQAILEIQKNRPAVVTLDLGLPPDAANVSEGLATLQEILSIAPDTKIIVITGNDDRENAINTIALGAYDFYQKPIEPDTIKIIIDRAIKLHKLEQEYNELLKVSSNSPLKGFVTVDQSMLNICRTVEKLAPTDAKIMLLGESGTGKEILARALHDLSNHKEQNFIAINCAAIPENLLESELFGYEKGAFTGAMKQTIGKVEMANGGTLFLDEIGDLSMPLQAKLLRFLQEKVIERVGGRTEIPVDVRVVSATHRDIKMMVEEENFREDLYYRLSEVTVNILPLRERSADAIVLGRYFMEKFSREYNKRITGFTAEAQAVIESYAWPGNVRELESTVKRAVIMSESSKLSDRDLGVVDSGEKKQLINLRDAREAAEKETIANALIISDGNVSKASELLGVSRPTLYDLLNKYELK